MIIFKEMKMLITLFITCYIHVLNYHTVPHKHVQLCQLKIKNINGQQVKEGTQTYFYFLRKMLGTLSSLGDSSPNHVSS